MATNTKLLAPFLRHIDQVDDWPQAELLRSNWTWKVLTADGKHMASGFTRTKADAARHVSRVIGEARQQGIPFEALRGFDQ